IHRANGGLGLASLRRRIADLRRVAHHAADFGRHRTQRLIGCALDFALAASRRHVAEEPSTALIAGGALDATPQWNARLGGLALAGLGARDAFLRVGRTD